MCLPLGFHGLSVCIGKEALQLLSLFISGARVCSEGLKQSLGLDLQQPDQSVLLPAHYSGLRSAAGEQGLAAV